MLIKTLPFALEIFDVPDLNQIKSFKKFGCLNAPAPDRRLNNFIVNKTNDSFQDP